MSLALHVRAVRAAAAAAAAAAAGQPAAGASGPARQVGALVEQVHRASLQATIHSTRRERSRVLSEE